MKKIWYFLLGLVNPAKASNAELADIQSVFGNVMNKAEKYAGKMTSEALDVSREIDELQKKRDLLFENANKAYKLGEKLQQFLK